MQWKRDYLALEATIKTFQQEHGYLPGEHNVNRLLRWHLNKARELLYAEVNGGLDEEYQDEADQLAHVATTSCSSKAVEPG